VFASVRKTGRVVILHEDSLTGGIGAELGARITEACFTALDAPVTRCASLDTPIPFNAELEKNFMANSRLQATIDQVLGF
jgi:2-oxoisovalerate dehydrogenase E1 component